MQRSLTYKDSLSGLLYVALFVAYESLSSIYLILPPLFAVLFFFYIRAMEQQSLSLFLTVSLMLLFYEADKGYLIFTSLIYFAFIYRFVLPKIRQLVDCAQCLRIIYVLLAYLGFWLFTLLISRVFWLPVPDIDWYVIYYILAEILIVGSL